MYLVDGYNLLFQTAFLSQNKSFEQARYALIRELDTLAEMQHASITVVFDAGFQTEELKRGHFGALEIIFTSRGQTADEFIVEYISHVHKRLTVVTSDKRLAKRLIAPHVTIEPVLDFIQRLRKKSRKKRLVPIVKEQPPAPKKVPVDRKIDLKNLPPLSDLETWEAIFTDKIKIRRGSS